MISAMPIGARRKRVLVCSSVVIRLPANTMTLKSTSAAARANAASRCSASSQE